MDRRRHARQCAVVLVKGDERTPAGSVTFDAYVPESHRMYSSVIAEELLHGDGESA